MSFLLWLLLVPAGSYASSTSALAPLGQKAEADDDAYLSWSEKECLKVGDALRSKGRVGGFFDTRIVDRNKSYNYKLRATWLTPEVIRAAARLKQFEQVLTDEETLALVAKAESIGDTIILVEIDPREGSGIIPREWVALLRPKTDEPSIGVRGTKHPKLRSAKALSGTGERDYSYDVFWLVFPLVDNDGQPLLPESSREAELVVRIHNKEGRVSWPIPASIRRRALEVARNRSGDR